MTKRKIKTVTDLPAWLPDWRDAVSYPAQYDDWSLGQWVWAFLRRNAEYQADYQHFSSLPSYYPGGGKTSKFAGRSACDDDDMALRYCDPPALPGETYRAYWRRLDGAVVAEMPLEAHLIEKWGISHLPSPSDDDGYRLISNAEENPPYWIQIEAPDPATGLNLHAIEPDRREHVTLRFDLRYSIDRQIEDAKSFLMDMLEHYRTGPFPFERCQAAAPRRTELPKYLRAFDADAAGANRRELGLMLYPEKNDEQSTDALKAAVSRAINAGKALVAGAYKELLKFG